MSLAETLTADMKAALKGGDKLRLGVLRMALAAVKQKAIDSREPVTDPGVIAVIEKMIKQGRDSVTQYEQAGRPELAEKENAEIAVLKAYLPEPLSADELQALIAEVMDEVGASSIKDMGKVMGRLKDKAAGRVDMSQVNTLVRAALTTE